jgi:hypothetical protein
MSRESRGDKIHLSQGRVLAARALEARRPTLACRPILECEPQRGLRHPLFEVAEPGFQFFLVPFIFLLTLVSSVSWFE